VGIDESDDVVADSGPDQPASRPTRGAIWDWGSVDVVVVVIGGGAVGGHCWSLTVVVH
jgi:hypothetical protein